MLGLNFNPMHGIHGARCETFVGVGVTIASAYAAKKKGDREAGYSRDANAVSDAYEREQNDRIAQTQAQIDAAYSNPRRSAQIIDFGSKMRSYLAERLRQQQTDEARTQKFALAKRGLTGGSVDASAGRRLAQMFSDQNVGLERQVVGAQEGLRQQDEQARIALRNQAGSGLSLTDAYRRSLAQQQQTLGNAQLDANNQTLGDFAAGGLAAYKKQRERGTVPPPRVAWGGGY